jgi:hypothetical protein
MTVDATAILIGNRFWEDLVTRRGLRMFVFLPFAWCVEGIFPLEPETNGSTCLGVVEIHMRDVLVLREVSKRTSVYFPRTEPRRINEIDWRVQKICVLAPPVLISNQVLRRKPTHIRVVVSGAIVR